MTERPQNVPLLIGQVAAGNLILGAFVGALAGWLGLAIVAGCCTVAAAIYGRALARI